MTKLVLVTWLWFAGNGNSCASAKFEEIPSGVAVITKEEIHIAPSVSLESRMAIRVERELRLAVERCPRPQDRKT